MARRPHNLYRPRTPRIWRPVARNGIANTIYAPITEFLNGFGKPIWPESGIKVGLEGRLDHGWNQ